MLRAVRERPLFFVIFFLSLIVFEGYGKHILVKTEPKGKGDEEGLVDYGGWSGCVLYDGCAPNCCSEDNWNGPGKPRGSCFGPNSSVETRRGWKVISELQIGDEIRTAVQGLQTDFTEFLGWLDRQESSPAEMLQLFTSDKYPVVTLSASHVVFTSNTTKYAGDLVPGDTLLHWTGVQMMELVISEIKPSLESGYWAPMTRAGTLLVDGYLMSCYASYPHQISDLTMLPVKALPLVLLDNEDSQHRDGVRPVVKILKQMGQWIGIRRQQKYTQGLPELTFGEDRHLDNIFSRKSEL